MVEAINSKAESKIEDTIEKRVGGSVTMAAQHHASPLPNIIKRAYLVVFPRLKPYGYRLITISMLQSLLLSNNSNPVKEKRCQQCSHKRK